MIVNDIFLRRIIFLLFSYSSLGGFPTMIGAISAISLEQNLYFLDECNIRGEFLLNGKYKLTEASRLEEEFHYKIPIEIVLRESIDLSTTNIDITDFTYEIEKDFMICHIEISIEGEEVNGSTLEKKLENRECDDEIKQFDEIEIPSIEKKEEEIPNKLSNEDVEEDSLKEEYIGEDISISEKKEIDEENNSLFVHLKDDDDSYGTFIVYIVRKNETINSIIEKYHTTKEELEKYNDISNVDIGTKLIIPFSND